VGTQKLSQAHNQIADKEATLLFLGQGRQQVAAGLPIVADEEWLDYCALLRWEDDGGRCPSNQSFADMTV